MSKNRKSIRTRIRSELRNLNTEIDPRVDRYKEQKNRFLKMKEAKKREKLLRYERKQARFHIGHRRDLRKRWELESETMEP